MNRDGSHAFPAHWESVELGDIAECVLGKMLDKAKNTGELRPYLGNINVRWGAFDLESLKEMRIKDDEVERYAVRDGDLIVCEGGEPGRCAVWRHGDGVFLQKALHRVRPREGVSSDYLAIFFRTLPGNPDFEDRLTGTTIKHLPGQVLRKLRVPLPPIQDQLRIVADVNGAFEAIADIAAMVDEAQRDLERLRRSVLHHAITGQTFQHSPGGKLATE